MPRMEKGTADSMSIVAMLVYMLDNSGESNSRVSVRICRIRKQIIEVTMTFRPTLKEHHKTVRRALLPFSNRVPGMVLSTTVTTASTEKKEQ
jgi:hypothetical protein